MNGLATMTENAKVSEIARESDFARRSKNTRDIDFTWHGKDASLIENT